MGGRGSSSSSARNNTLKDAGISLLGGNPAVMVTSILDGQDKRKDVNDISSLAGFVGGSYGTDAIDTQSMSTYMLHLHRLEKEYGALGAVPTSIHGATGRGFLAAVSEDGKGNATLLLHVGHMKNAAKRAKGEITAQQTHHHMPIDGRLTSRAGYTITHEYGHLVQHALYQRALKNGYNGTEEAFRQRAFVSIASSAVRKYGATGKDLSNYGRNNAAEFFAESFANANLGAPNAFGRAMQDYLKSNPLR